MVDVLCVPAVMAVFQNGCVDRRQSTNMCYVHNAEQLCNSWGEIIFSRTYKRFELFFHYKHFVLYLHMTVLVSLRTLFLYACASFTLVMLGHIKSGYNTEAASWRYRSVRLICISTIKSCKYLLQLELYKSFWLSRWVCLAAHWLLGVSH